MVPLQLSLGLNHICCDKAQLCILSYWLVSVAVVELLQVEPQETWNFFEAHREAVLRTPGCEVGILVSPYRQAQTSRNVYFVHDHQCKGMGSNNASSVFKLLRYVGCDVM